MKEMRNENASMRAHKPCIDNQRDTVQREVRCGKGSMKAEGGGSNKRSMRYIEGETMAFKRQEGSKRDIGGLRAN